MQPPSDTLIARYLAGECSPAEAHEIERWAWLDPANTARLDGLRALWAARAPEREWDVDGMWTTVRETMRAERRPPPVVVHHHAAHGARRRLTVPLAAAAALALAAGTTIEIVRLSHRPPPVPAVRPAREYATTRGQRATIQLTDGSRLVLAPESRVHIAADFGTRARELYLDGEALFDVVHDAARPFRVSAKGATAEDIGTRFDVRAYRDDSTVAVAVAEGAVALGRTAPSGPQVSSAGAVAPEGLVVTKGQVATLAQDGRVTVAPTTALAGYLAWAEGRLHFADARLPEVLRAVGRWWDLDVRVEGRALAGRTVTAEFSTQSEDEMLRALALAVDARVTRAGRVVTLRPK